MKLYTWNTPNGYKPLILLEELELDYEIVNVPLDGSQKTPQYLLVNPNGKIPALEDGDVIVFESGAILMYLAEKFGEFLPKDLKERYLVIEWLMFQMAGVGPMLGQHFHFTVFAKEKVPYAIKRYEDETKRLLDVIELKLSKTKYIALDSYSIADISLYPWIKAVQIKTPNLLENYSNIINWMNKISDRAAVKKVYSINF